MPPQTSSLRAYGLRAQTGRTACSFAAIAAALSAAPSPAVADHAYDAALTKTVEGVKPGKGIGRGREALPVAPVPDPTVEAPTVSPVPDEAPTPAPTESPAPVPTVSAPEPPRSTPAAPTATPDRASSPAPRPTREAVDEGVAVGVAPDGGGPAAGPTPDAPRSATPTAPGRAAPAPARRRTVRVPAPPRVTGGLVDLADRSGGRESAPARGRGSTGATTVTYREDSTGRRVYTVPSSDGTGRREVSVPGGVFGILPSAAIEATAEVAGAIEEGRALPRPSAQTDEAGSSGVVATLTRPLAAVDDVAGGRFSTPLIVVVLVAAALALALGIRRRQHRW